MKPKTELVLYELLWGFEHLMRPTLRNLTESFEAWASRNGYLPQIRYLARRDFLRRQTEKASGETIYRLTTNGRSRVLGGRDPVTEWQRAWDGRWRWIVFDLPEVQKSARRKLRIFLHEHGFGCLQRSLYLSPDPFERLAGAMTIYKGLAKTLVMIEGHCLNSTPDSALVAAAWDFEEINRGYQQCLDHLNHPPVAGGKDAERSAKRRTWLQREQASWLTTVAEDPLLPAALLPPDYLGKRVWQKRQEVLAKIITADGGEAC